MKPAYVDSRRRQADSEQETLFPIICIQKPHETEKQKFWKVIWYLKILNYSGFLKKFNQSDCMIWDTWSKLTNEEARISITFNCH